MDRPDLKTIKGWTVVEREGVVNHVETFDEALELQTRVGGSMMSTNYYNYIWKVIH